MVIGFAAIVIAGAITLGSEWIAATGDISQSATVTAQKDSVRHAARRWYASRFCRLQRQSEDAGRPAPVMERGIDDLRSYLPAGRLVREGTQEATRWRAIVARQPLSTPQLHLTWQLHEGEPAAGLARRTGAVCDTDGDRATAEACADFAVGTERLLWTSLLVEPTSQDDRTRRLLEWQHLNGINCDRGSEVEGDGPSEGDGILDAHCDPDGDGRFGPYDADGDGLDDAKRYDADADGTLDLDITGADGSADLVVDIRDWQALGC